MSVRPSVCLSVHPSIARWTYRQHEILVDAKSAKVVISKLYCPCPDTSQPPATRILPLPACKRILIVRVSCLVKCANVCWLVGWSRSHKAHLLAYLTLFLRTSDSIRGPLVCPPVDSSVRDDRVNKAGYTANTSHGRVGRGGNTRYRTFQLDHH